MRDAPVAACPDGACDVAGGECATCAADCDVADCCGADPLCNAGVGEDCSNCADCSCTAPQICCAGTMMEVLVPLTLATTLALALPVVLILLSLLARMEMAVARQDVIAGMMMIAASLVLMVFVVQERIVQIALIVLVSLLKSAAPEPARIRIAVVSLIVMMEVLVPLTLATTLALGR